VSAAFLPRDLVELSAPIPASRYAGQDLLPTPLAERTWNRWHFASLWVGMSVCIPTYMLAAALIQAGLTWRASLAAILIGNAIALVPMLLNGHAGTRHGIPFPVFLRAAFGLRGAHVPALLRGGVACGWFGIQTWVGGQAIYEILSILSPGWSLLGGDWRWMGFALPQYLGFLVFWLINLYFVWAGTESIKWLETLSAPLLIAAGLALLWWAAARVGGFGPMLRGASALGGANGVRPFSFGLYLPWVTAMVGFWATLALNIPDFTRFARSQKDQAVGQALGLLTTMPLFAFIGLAVTSATVTIYGEAIWNPVTLVAFITADLHSPILGIVALVVLLVATLTTSIAANIVAPANAIANLAPRRIGTRVGGLIAALLGVAILPWKLLDSYQTWLITYSGLLGAVGGVLVCDYLLVRRGTLSLPDLYAEGGAYWYDAGINRRAMAAMTAGVLIALAGLLHPSLRFLFDGAWFSAAVVAFVLYAVLMRPSAMPAGLTREAP
jgi:NCS1 family nucleobase:cation symporter-1